MQQRQTGDGWTVEVQDNIMIWEFLPGMELSAFKEDAYPVFEDLLTSHDFDGMVTDVSIDDPFTKEVFGVWEKSAQRAAEGGIERWAVVAEGISAISLRGKVNTDGLETLTTEDRSEAIEWAKA
jgi:hypothetical protein